MNQDDIKDLRRRTSELNREAGYLHREADRLRDLEANLADLGELAAGLAAAGRCGAIQFQHQHYDPASVLGPWTFAWPCVKPAGHPGDCGFGHMTVPAPGAPSATEKEREAAETEVRAAELDEQATAGERQLAAEAAIVPEPGDTILTLKRETTREGDRWDLTERDVPLTVLETYTEDGRGVVVRAADEDDAEWHLIRSWHDPRYWFYICGYPTGAGYPCRAGYLGYGPRRTRCHAHGAVSR